MSITQQHTQEQLSRAYVIAIAGVAGINLSNVREHDYGVDGTFRPVTTSRNLKGETIRSESGFSVDFQLKSCINCEETDAAIKYDCETDTYNKLVMQNGRQGAAPIVLLVLCQPHDQTAWTSVTTEALLIRGGCYWSYLTGETATNVRTKRISIPRLQLFTPDALQDIIDRVNQEGTP